jgi:mitochondrial inner membrane protease ATP23
MLLAPRYVLYILGEKEVVANRLIKIRASSLSGECRWTREFFTRNHWTVTQQHQNCVRMRAIKSVMNRPSCKDDVQATKVVNEVWDSCFADTRPFERIYR